MAVAHVDEVVEVAVTKARVSLLRACGEKGVCRYCAAGAPESGTVAFWVRNRRGSVVLIDSKGVNHTLACPKRPGQGRPEDEE